MKDTNFRLRVSLAAFAVALFATSALVAQRPERPALDIIGYVINAEIDTATHHLTAKTQVTFTAPENC